MALQTFEQAFNEDQNPFTIFIGSKAYDGYAASVRIDRNTVPDGWYVYDMRHDDFGDICEIKDGYIFANHMATFFTRHKLPIPGSLFRNGEEDDEFDYSYD